MREPVGSPRRGPVARGGGFVALALAGAWVGHAATWYLTGGVSPGQALSGTLHTYLEPIGAALVLLGLLASGLVWRGLHRLNLVGLSTRRALRRAWRLDGDPAPTLVGTLDPEGPDTVLSPARVWLALVTVQLLVYLAQENVEARAVGRGWPGLRVLTVHHGSALFIHAVVALALTALAVELVDRVATRRRSVVRAVGRLRALLARRRPVVVSASPVQVVSPSPRARFGSARLPRPPPVALAH